MANIARAQEEAKKNSTTTDSQTIFNGLDEENKKKEEEFQQNITNTNPQPDPEPPVNEDSQTETPPARSTSETYNLEAEVERFVNNLFSPITSATTDTETLVILTAGQASFSMLLYDSLKDLPPESQQWVETFLETGNYAFEEFPVDKFKTLESIDVSKNWGELSPEQQSAMTSYLSSSIDGYDEMTDAEKTAALETQWNGMDDNARKTAVNIEKVNTINSGIQDIYSTLSQEISKNTGVDMAKSDVVAGLVFGAVSTGTSAAAMDWSSPEKIMDNLAQIGNDFIPSLKDGLGSVIPDGPAKDITNASLNSLQGALNVVSEFPVEEWDSMSNAEKASTVTDTISKTLDIVLDEWSQYLPNDAKNIIIASQEMLDLTTELTTAGWSNPDAVAENVSNILNTTAGVYNENIKSMVPQPYGEYISTGLTAAAGVSGIVSNAMAFDWKNATPEQKAAQGVSIASDFINTIDDIDFAAILGAISPQLLPIGMAINTALDTIGPWLEKLSSGLDKIQEQQEKEQDEQQTTDASNSRSTSSDGQVTDETSMDGDEQNQTQDGQTANTTDTTDVSDEQQTTDASNSRSTSSDGQVTDETSMDGDEQNQTQDGQGQDRQAQEDEEDLNKTTVTRQTVYNKDGDITRDVTITSVTNVDESGKITETRTCAWTVPDNWAPQTNVKTTEKDEQGNTTVQYTFWDGDNQYTETTVIDKDGNQTFTDRDGNVTQTLATSQEEESVVVTMGSGDAMTSSTYSFGATQQQEEGASR